MDASPGGVPHQGESQNHERLSGEHPQFLQNEMPNFVLQYYSFVIEFVQSYGWFLIIGLIALYYIKQKLSPSIESYRRKKEEQDYLNVDPNVARQRMEAMDMARRRLQEQHDSQAARYAEEMKKKEEEKRKAKIEDWERHQRGAGYRSKYRPEEPSQGGASGSSDPKAPKAKKNVYRNNDYMPLGGGAGAGGSNDSCGWRPGRRGGARGG